MSGQCTNGGDLISIFFDQRLSTKYSAIEKQLAFVTSIVNTHHILPKIKNELDIGLLFRVAFVQEKYPGVSPYLMGIKGEKRGNHCRFMLRCK